MLLAANNFVAPVLICESRPPLALIHCSPLRTPPPDSNPVANQPSQPQNKSSWSPPRTCALPRAVCHWPSTRTRPPPYLSVSTKPSRRLLVRPHTISPSFPFGSHANFLISSELRRASMAGGEASSFLELSWTHQMGRRAPLGHPIAHARVSIDKGAHLHLIRQIPSFHRRGSRRW